jgi:nitric oxide reductase NorE protein
MSITRTAVPGRRSPDQAAAKRVPGEEGTWVFIFGDMLIFAVIFITYLHYRGQQVAMFNESQKNLVGGFGVANTLLLLSSSLLVVVGMRAINRRRSDLAPWMFMGAMACGLAFSTLKIVEYGEKLSAGVTPATNDFYMYYFILTGLHFFHLIVGMVILAAIAWASTRPVNASKKYALIEGGACFWHMVDLLWIILFPLLYLVN